MKTKGVTGVEKGSMFGVKLAVNQAPKITKDQTKSILKWGNGNKYPERLLFWLNNDAEHGAICKGKARYITGLKTLPDPNIPESEAWLKLANTKESWHDIRKKMDMDEVICGGYFLKIVSNALGQPIQFFHLDFAKCRMSDCMRFVKYSNDWSDFNEPITTFPVWNTNTVGTSVFIYKQYVPTSKKIDGAYPQPEYLSCTLDIDTDVRISTFGNSLVSKNFSAGHIVTIFNGEKDPAQQKKIKDKINATNQGEENTGETVVVFTDVNGKPTEIAAVPTNELDKQYEVISKRNQQKKLTGHNVSGILFKIKTEGQLGNRTELVEAHELFINEYAKVKQEVDLNILANFYFLRYGVNPEFSIEQVKPIGLELPLDNQNVVNALNAKSPDIITNYLIDKYSIEIPETASSGPTIQQGQVNDNIKNLTGKQFQGVQRIMRKYDKGEITRQVAMHMMTSMLGITESEAKIYLNIADEDGPTADKNIQQCSHVLMADQKMQRFFALFEKYSQPINEQDEVLNVRYIDRVQFAQEPDVPKEVLDNVLVAVKGNPEAIPETISSDLKIPTDVVVKAIEALVAYKLIEKVSGSFIPTQKGLDYEIESEIYTEYVYDKRPDVSGPVLIPTSREFCQKMVYLTRFRSLTYEAINKLENEFGENVWDFRGGYYNNGTETTPWCRHVWSAVTKVRRRSK